MKKKRSREGGRDFVSFRSTAISTLLLPLLIEASKQNTNYGRFQKDKGIFFILLPNVLENLLIFQVSH